MKILLAVLLVCSLSGQVIYLPMTTAEVEMEIETVYPIHIDSTETISAEELYLKKISDEALAKEERKEKITNRVLITIIAILLIDKFVN